MHAPCRYRVIRVEPAVEPAGHPASLHRDRGPRLERIGRVEVGERHRGIRLCVASERSNQGTCPPLARLEGVRPEAPVAVSIRRDVAHPVVRTGDVVDRGFGPPVIWAQIGPGLRRDPEPFGAGCVRRERSWAAAVLAVRPGRWRRLCRTGSQRLRERHHQGQQRDGCQATAKPLSPLGHTSNVGPPRTELEHRG